MPLLSREHVREYFSNRFSQSFAMSLLLTIRTDLSDHEVLYQSLSVQGLLPEFVATQSLADIKQLLVLCDNRPARLCDFFHVDGNPEDKQIECSGDFSRVHFLGAGMQSGTIIVQGNVGRHSGEQMRGGKLLIKGSVADWFACGMEGGEIHVHGDAANNAVGSLPGDRQGMTGGRVIIDGSVGALAGSRMRRGLLAIGGNAGDATGFELLAGTILVAGQPGPHTGLGMRRGSIVLLGTKSFCHEASTYIPPTFLQGGIWRPTFMALLGRHLVNTGFSAARKTAWRDPWQQWHGDSLAGCRGEILTPANA